jgi:predicted MPP superfamily phosphohydrolase
MRYNNPGISKERLLMRLSIAHISDCHFRAGQSRHLELREPLVKAIAALEVSSDALLLAVTGDIAFSGEREEYKLGLELIEYVREQLRSRVRIPVYCAVVPGNHDCSFSEEPAVRKALLATIGPGAAWDSSVPEACTSVQQPFFAFALNVTDSVLHFSSKDLICTHRLSIDSHHIGVWGINSAWMSQIHERPGSIWFPVHLLQQQVEAADSAFNILLLHHPFAWFKPEVRREFLLLVDSAFDLVLCGHEHITEAWARDDLNGQKTLILEGGVVQEHGAAAHSSLNFVALDLDRNGSIVTYFPLEYNGQRFVPGEKKTAVVDSGKHSAKPYRKLSDQCLSYLRSAGATFRHPHKPGPLNLEDIYVEPDLVDLKSAREVSAIEKRISTSSVLGQIHLHPYVALGGAEKAGKSTWLRWAYQRLHHAGLTPVRIEGGYIRHEDVGRTLRLIDREYLQQYATKDVSAWSQLDSSSKALLIDDFDVTRLNQEARKAILSNLKRKFGTILLTCDDTLLLSDSPSSEFEGFERYQLPEFGHRLRDLLISRWLRLGSAATLEVSAFQVVREQRVRAINSLLGQSFIPARPIFLLTLLQSMELSGEASVRGSSLGEYYEYLIRHALIGARIDVGDLDAVLNYLTELGYFMLSQPAPMLSSGALASFDANFSLRYDIRMNFDVLHRQLTESDVIEVWDDQIRFKYRYALLFFGARYLAKHFGKDAEVTSQVRAIGTRVKISKYADLMLFIVHHSHDPAVLDMILEETNKSFADANALRLDETDAATINDLAIEVPRLALSDEPNEIRRERRLNVQDEREYVAAAREESDLSLSTLQEDSVVEALDYIDQTTSALRIIAILGQVLRNYYGSLRAERKEQIANASYQLLSRVLGSHLSILRNDQESLVEWLANELEKRGASSPEKGKSLANRYVFGLLSLLVFTHIKRASECLGSDKLLPTHEKVSGAVDSPLSRLLRVAISLDYPVVGSSGGPRLVPIQLLEGLHAEFKRNPCADFVLRRLVLDYLYMFEVSYKDKQRICDSLGISTRRQQQIQMASQRKRV